jgi:NAD-dependent dihydropyrimidine dehydrogenase PreA subunit
MAEKAYLVPNPAAAFKAIIIDADLCTGCLECVEVCRTDVLVPSQEQGAPPIVLYPDECWFCGSCVAHCLSAGAITMEHPLYQRVGWKRKKTGEHFRIGMKNPPPPNTKPPVC